MVAALRLKHMPTPMPMPMRETVRDAMLGQHPAALWPYGVLQDRLGC